MVKKKLEIWIFFYTDLLFLRRLIYSKNNHVHSALLILDFWWWVLMIYCLFFLTLQANSNHSMLGVHASAQAIIHFGKIARKHGLTGVCLDSLSRFGNVIYPFGIVIYPMKMLFILWKKLMLFTQWDVIYSLEMLFTHDNENVIYP